MKGDGEGSAAAPRQLTHKQAVEFALNTPAIGSAPRNLLVERRRRLYAEAAAVLLEELADAGFPNLTEVGELYRRNLKYQVLVPILVRWLPRVTFLPLAEDIVRTLTVGFAKKLALPEFLRLFRDVPSVEDPFRPSTVEPAAEQLRLAIGFGLGKFAGPDVADELIELVLDTRYGPARIPIVRELPKTRDERLPTVLVGLLDDPPVRAFAVEALGKMRFKGAREAITAMLADPDKNVRDQARKALKRIDG